MASQLVGMENIPNVYISKINLGDVDTKTYSVDVFFEIMDKLQNGNYIWSSEETYYNYLNVVMVATHNPDLTQQLTVGLQSPLPKEIVKSPFYNEEETKFQVLSLREFMNSTEENYRIYRKKTTFMSKFRADHLTIFAACYLDTDGLSNLFEINLGGPLKEYYGAVTSEKIIENNSIVTTTNLFLNPNGSVWSGPVHYHKGNGFMAGSKHSDTPHQDLTRVKVQNVKLSDDRTKVWKERSTTSTPTNAIVSEALYSVNNNADLFGMFSVNCKQFALTKTKHGRKMFEVNMKLFNEFLNTIQIDSISIVRRQIKSVRVKNSVGSPKVGTLQQDAYDYIATTMDSAPNRLVNTEKIQQIYLNSNNMIRNYQFQDDSKTYKDRGQYRYKLLLSIVDKSQAFIQEKLDVLAMRLSDLETTVERLNRKTNYNYQLNKLRSDQQVPSSIIDDIKTYYETLSYFRTLSQSDINKMVSDRMTLFLNGTYTPKSANRFVKDYKALITVFARKFKVYNRYDVTTKPHNIKKAFMPGLILIEKEFEEIISFSNYSRSYDCLGVLNNQGFARLTKSQYATLGQKELEKYFDLSHSLISDDLDSLSSQYLSSVTDLQASKNLFLTPQVFYYKEQSSKIDLSHTDASFLQKLFLDSVENHNMHVVPFRKSFGKERSRRRNSVSSPRSRQRLNFKNNRKAFTFSTNVAKFDVIENAEEIFEESTQYLGNSSKFANPTGIVKEPPQPVENEEIRKNVNTSTQFKKRKNKFAYDIRAPNSVLSDYLSSKKPSPTLLRRAPLAFKALVCSRSKAAKNNILESDHDILVDPETLPLSEMVFQTSQKIEMLMGYERDENNEPVLSSPVWQTIDLANISEKDTVVCRMVYVDIPQIGMSTPRDFKLPVQNQIFIISPDDVITPLAEPTVASAEANINMVTKNELSENIKFATSNIVKQSSRKNLLTTLKTTTNQPAATGVVRQTPTVPGGRY